MLKYSTLEKLFDSIKESNTYKESVERLNVFIAEGIVQLKRALLLGFFGRGDIYERIYEALYCEFKGRRTLEQIIPIIDSWHNAIKTLPPTDTTLRHYRNTLILGFFGYVENDPKLFKHPFYADIVNSMSHFVHSLLKERVITKKNYDAFQKLYGKYRAMNHKSKVSFDFFHNELTAKFEEIVCNLDEDLC